MNGIKIHTLVLDLDETLVRCTEEKPEKYDFIIEISENEIYYVNKRPYLEEFLEFCSFHFNLMLFTAAKMFYADMILEKIDPKKKYFLKRFYREDCTLIEGAYVKDLSKI